MHRDILNCIVDNITSGYIIYDCIKRRYCADLDAAAKQRYDEKLDILPGLVDDP